MIGHARVAARRLAVAAALSAALAAPGAPAPGREAPAPTALAAPPASPAGRAGRAGLSEADWRGIRGILSEFRAGVLAGEPEKVLAILSPTLPLAERASLEETLAREFAEVRYVSLEIEDPRASAAELPAAAPAEARLDLRPVVTAVFRRRAGGAGAGPGGEAAPEHRLRQETGFEVERVAGRWFLRGSDLLGAMGQEGTIPRAFRRGLAGVAALFLLALLSIWATADCAVRYRRVGLALAVLLTPPVGPVVYLLLGPRRRAIRKTP